MILHEREIGQFRKQVEDLLSETYRTPVSLKRPRFMPSRPNVCRFVVQRGPAVLGNGLVVKRLRTVETEAASATRYPSSESILKTTEQCRFSLFCFLPLLFVLKQDYRRGEIAPLDACQVTLMRIDLRYHLCEGKKISVFHERN